MSVEWYTRIERGAISGVSPEVLDAVSKALLLDDAERAHLFDLAAAASPARRPPRRRHAKTAKTWTPHPSLQWLLDATTAGPAFVRNGQTDLLAANPIGRAFYAPVYDTPGQPPNIARHMFLEKGAGSSTPTGSSLRRSPWPSCAPRWHGTSTTSSSMA